MTSKYFASADNIRHVLCLLSEYSILLLPMLAQNFALVFYCLAVGPLYLSYAAFVQVEKVSELCKDKADGQALQTTDQVPYKVALEGVYLH